MDVAGLLVELLKSEEVDVPVVDGAASKDGAAEATGVEEAGAPKRGVEGEAVCSAGFAPNSGLDGVSAGAELVPPKRLPVPVLPKFVETPKPPVPPLNKDGFWAADFASGDVCIESLPNAEFCAKGLGLSALD